MCVYTCGILHQEGLLMLPVSLTVKASRTGRTTRGSLTKTSLHEKEKEASDRAGDAEPLFICPAESSTEDNNGCSEPRTMHITTIRTIGARIANNSCFRSSKILTYKLLIIRIAKTTYSRAIQNAERLKERCQWKPQLQHGKQHDELHLSKRSSRWLLS